MVKFEIMALPGCPQGEFWEEGSRHCVSCSMICDQEISGEDSDSDCNFRCPAYFEEPTTMESVITPRPTLPYSMAASKQLIITMACSTGLLLTVVICLVLAKKLIRRTRRDRKAPSDIEGAGAPLYQPKGRVVRSCFFICCQPSNEPAKPTTKVEVEAEDVEKPLIGLSSESEDSSSIDSYLVHSKDSIKELGSTAATGTQNNKQPGSQPDTQNNKQPGSQPDTQNNKQPGSQSDTQNNKQPASLPDTQNNEQPGSQPDTQNNKQPGSQPDTQNNKQPGSQPDTQTNKQPGSQPDTQTNKQPGSQPDTQNNKQPGNQPDTQNDKQPGSQPDTQNNKQPGSQPDTQNNKQPGSQPDTQNNKQPESQQDTQNNKQPGSQPDTQNNKPHGSQPDTQNNKQPGSQTDTSTNLLLSAISPRERHLELPKTSSKSSLTFDCIEPRATSRSGVVEIDDTDNTEPKVLSEDSGDLAVDGGPPSSIGDNQGQVSNHSTMSEAPPSLSLTESIDEVCIEVNLQADVDSPVPTHKSISESVYEYLDGESWVRICMFSNNRLKILVKGKSSEEAKRLILHNTSLTEGEITVASLVDSSFHYLTGGGEREKHSLMKPVYFKGDPNKTDDEARCTRLCVREGNRCSLSDFSTDPKRDAQIKLNKGAGTTEADKEQLPKPKKVLRSSTVGGFLETNDGQTQYLITSGHRSGKGTKYYLDQSLYQPIGTCEFHFWDNRSDIAFVRLEAGAKDKLCNHLVLTSDGAVRWFSPQICTRDLSKLANSNQSARVYKQGPKGLVPGKLVQVLIDKEGDTAHVKQFGIDVTDWPAGACSPGDSGSLIVADPVFPHVAAYGLVTGLFTVKYGGNQTKEENICGMSPLWPAIKRVQELQRTHHIPVQDFKFVKCKDVHGAPSTWSANEPAANGQFVHSYQPLPVPNESAIANIDDTFAHGAVALADASSDSPTSLFEGTVETDVEADGPPSSLLEADPKGHIEFSDDEGYSSRLASSFVIS